jgi:hypothetical protein
MSWLVKLAGMAQSGTALASKASSVRYVGSNPAPGGSIFSRKQVYLRGDIFRKV